MIRITPVTSLRVLSLLLASCSSQLAAPQISQGNQGSQSNMVEAQALTPSSFVSTLYSASSNSCLDVPGGSTSTNQPVTNVACTTAAEQQFTFTPLTNRPGAYTIVNAASKL